MRQHVKLRPLKETEYIIQKINEPSKVFQRNPIEKTEYEYKPVGKTVFDTSIYKENFNKINNNQPWNQEDSFELFRPKEEHSYMKSFYNVSQDKRIDHYEPSHMENYYLYRQKKKIDKLNNSGLVGLSPILPKEDYSKIKFFNEKRGSAPTTPSALENDDVHVLRKNLYVTKFKNEYGMNKDFKEKEIIDHTSAISKDTPSWLQKTMKYFYKDFHDSAIVTRNLASREIVRPTVFGNEKPEYPKLMSKFDKVPPYEGQVWDKKAVVLVDKRSKSEMRGGLDLSWREERAKQRYDRGNVASKIGSINSVCLQALKPTVSYRKIGENENGMRTKIIKSVATKIGHPNESYLLK